MDESIPLFVCIWQALVAFKLYKSMAHEAAQDDLEVDISEEFKGYARSVYAAKCTVFTQFHPTTILMPLAAWFEKINTAISMLQHS